MQSQVNEGSHHGCPTPTGEKYDTRTVSDPIAQDEYLVHYFEPGEIAVFKAPDDHHYYFETYVGKHERIEVPRGGSAVYLSADARTAIRVRGPATITDSEKVCTMLPGFWPPAATKSLDGLTVLPYVNGCSTKQVFPPDRPGDPTLQYLRIPANSAEQAHHIHPTVRVVYTLEGHGTSVVGMEKNTVTEELVPGKVCILEPMCPHHFETPFGKKLIVVPFHVFSTVACSERSHPMFDGTFLMSQS